MLRRRCVSLSNQLGQMRTAEVALKKQNEELKSQRELRREALGEKGAPASPAETGAMPATRRGRAEKSMVDLKPAVVAEQMRTQLDAADARLKAETEHAQTRVADAEGPGEARGPKVKSKARQGDTGKEAAKDAALVATDRWPDWLRWLRRGAHEANGGPGRDTAGRKR